MYHKRTSYQSTFGDRRIRILIVQDDEQRRAAMLDTFGRASPGKYDLVFRSLSAAAAISGAGPSFDVAMVDFSTDPKGASHAAWRVRSMNGEAGIAVIAPSPEFMIPAEVVELGLGPLVVWDEEGLASMPSIAEAMVEGDGPPQTGMAAQSLLKLRNQELRDITDGLARQSVHLIRLRNELAAEKSKIETVINGMTDGMVYFDNEGRMEIANPVARALFPSLKLDAAPMLDDFIGLLKKNVRADEKSRDDSIFETGIDDKVYRVRPSQVFDAEGKAAGLLILLTDITRDKEYEELKNDFTSMISHELRTPLTSIGAAVDNFLGGALGDVNEKQLKFLQIIKRNVNRQRALVDDLLDLAKFEAGQMELAREKTGLASLVGLCVEQFSLAFQDRKINLEFTDMDGPVEMWVDGGLITQVVNNLLSNALKFTPDGGCVVVSVNAAPGGGMISVRDTGIGIPSDQAARIFEKYTQIDSSTRRRYAGTGLGLAIVREIVTAHKGSVTVESEPGKGSVFRIFLPSMGD
jgi:signal transduction histidine kinase